MAETPGLRWASLLGVGGSCSDPGVRRVYLDQNKWLDLARAAHGAPGGERFVGALAGCRAAVASGEVVFPLDVHRWMETTKRRDDGSRRRLASVMTELSQRHGLCRARPIVEHEIDAALHELCGRPVEVRPVQVHGRGLGHMMGGGFTFPPMRVPVGVDPKDPRLDELREQYETLLEAALLGSNPAARDTPEMRALVANMDQDVQYAAVEQRVAEALRELGPLRGDDLYEALAAADLGDIMRTLGARLEAAGLGVDEFVESLLASSPWALVQRLPTRHVTTVMRAYKHAQGQQKWTPNDLNDVVGLPVAVVHCDVVVTEKQWVDAFRRTGVGEQYKTVLLSDTAALVDVLAG